MWCLTDITFTRKSVSFHWINLIEQLVTVSYIVSLALARRNCRVVTNAISVQDHTKLDCDSWFSAIANAPEPQKLKHHKHVWFVWFNDSKNEFLCPPFQPDTDWSFVSRSLIDGLLYYSNCPGCPGALDSFVSWLDWNYAWFPFEFHHMALITG